MLETLFIAVEIYAVIWEILVLNGVIVTPHLFWYGTSGDSPFSPPRKNYMKINLTELFKPSYYSHSDIARMVSSSKTADWVPGCVKYVLFRLLSIQEKWKKRLMERSETSSLVTYLYPFSSAFLAVLSVLENRLRWLRRNLRASMCQVVVLIFTVNVTDTSRFVGHLPRYVLSTL
jgi:hypothetical protein